MTNAKPYKLSYIKKTRVSRDAWDLHFVKPNNFDYMPGQFIEAVLPQQHPDDRGEKRWFTLSSSPTEKTIDITTRKMPQHSSFKDVLFGLKKGDELSIKGPEGNFLLPKNVSAKIVWIAGGIGITPFRSQLKYLLDTKSYNRDITLFYGLRSKADNICQTLLIDAQQKFTNYKLVEVISEDPPKYWSGETGYIGADMLKKYLDVDLPIEYFVSGPEPMVDAFKEKLTNLNIQSDRIHQDWFPGYTETY